MLPPPKEQMEIFKRRPRLLLSGDVQFWLVAGLGPLARWPSPIIIKNPIKICCRRIIKHDGESDFWLPISGATPSPRSWDFRRLLTFRLIILSCILVPSPQKTCLVMNSTKTTGAATSKQRDGSCSATWVVEVVCLKLSTETKSCWPRPW